MCTRGYGTSNLPRERGAWKDKSLVAAWKKMIEGFAKKEPHDCMTKGRRE